MTLQQIFSRHTPPARQVYCHAMVVNDLIFCSGQLPKDPKTNKLVEGGVEECTHQCIANLRAVLEEAGSSLGHAVEVNVFLADMANFDKMNTAYGKYWGSKHRPARTCVAVKGLPEDALVEIKCVAVCVRARSSL